MTGYEFLLNAAQITNGDGDHWFRYLNKVINEKGTNLTEDDIDKLLHSHLLSSFQKVTLRDAVTEGTYTHEFISSWTKPGWKPVWAIDLNTALERLRQKYGSH